MSRWRVLLFVLGGVGYAVLSHWTTLFHPTEAWAVGVLLGPLWLTALGLCASRFGVAGVIAVVLVGVGFAVWVGRSSGHVDDVNRLYVLQHVAINLLLCGWFGSTLRAGRLSLIGSFAERVHPLTPEHAAYTWQVTRVWTVYFALMATASVLVYALLPFSAWSLLSNLLSPLMIGALFIGEFLLRYRIHPEFERVTLAQALEACRGGHSVPLPLRLPLPLPLTPPTA